MFCYPEKIKNLPNYKVFEAEIRAINKSGFTGLSKKRDRKEVSKKYGIELIPLFCDDECPYKKDCDIECKELREQING